MKEKKKESQEEQIKKTGFEPMTSAMPVHPSKLRMHAACMIHACCMHENVFACMQACMHSKLHAC